MDESKCRRVLALEWLQDLNWLCKSIRGSKFVTLDKKIKKSEMVRRYTMSTMSKENVLVEGW